MRKPTKSIPLFLFIVLTFLVLMAVIAGAMLFYVYRKNSETLIQVGQSFMEQSAGASIMDVARLVERPNGAIKGLTAFAHIDPARIRDKKWETLYYLYEIASQHPVIYATTLSFAADGMFIQIVRLPEGTEHFGVGGTRPPDGARFVANIVERHGDKLTSFYRYMADWDHPLKDEEFPTTYDPRSRPFYTITAAAMDRTITDVYPFASTGKPGVTLSWPMAGKADEFIGVAAANLTLDSISDFLKQEAKTLGGTMFIVDNKGYLVVHPQADLSIRHTASGIELVKAEECADPLVASVAKRARELGAVTGLATSNSFRFQIRDERDGQPLNVSVVPFPAEFGKEWSVINAVPTSVFLHGLEEANRTLMIASVGAGILVVIAVSLLARRVTKPIERLRRQANNIRELDLSQVETGRSGISEIQSLEDTMKAMGGAISAFSSFIPRELVRQLLANGEIEPGGESQYLTIFFSDVVGFSTLAESMPARKLLRHVSAYLEESARIIGLTRGTVDKYIGDSVMAFWGAPNPLHDHAYLACVAALEIRIAMARLNATWVENGDPQLAIRMGINTDTVIVGSIGSRERMSYTVMGDGVNVASRLEGINREYATGICVSHSVFREAGERLWLRPIDRVAVKGRREKQIIYELVGLREGADSLLASSEQQILCAMTEQAFNVYQARQWHRASTLYDEVAGSFPHDGLAPIMADRCRALMTERRVDIDCK